VLRPSAASHSLPSPGETQSRNACHTPGLGPARYMNPATPSFESRTERLPSDKLIRLAWVDERGQARCTAARCIDISSRRIHIEVAVQIPLRTPVMLRAEGISVAGSASVRYVTRCADNKFILVLDIR
jgi:hypothetical protein